MANNLQGVYKRLIHFAVKYWETSKDVHIWKVRFSRYFRINTVSPYYLCLYCQASQLSEVVFPMEKSFCVIQDTKKKDLCTIVE
jgi:hypothetical protein